MANYPKHIDRLPFAQINALLKLTIANDTVHISDMALAHIRERHPDDFDQCLQALPDIIRKPEYIGQSPRHPDNFVLVKENNGLIILVAISATADEYGDLPMLSAYLIDRNVLHRRLRKGFFKRL